MNIAITSCNFKNLKFRFLHVNQTILNDVNVHRDRHARIINAITVNNDNYELNIKYNLFANMKAHVAQNKMIIRCI